MFNSITGLCNGLSPISSVHWANKCLTDIFQALSKGRVNGWWEANRSEFYESLPDILKRQGYSKRFCNGEWRPWCCSIKGIPCQIKMSARCKCIVVRCSGYQDSCICIQFKSSIFIKNWGQVTHKCVSKLGHHWFRWCLSHSRSQTIVWTNVGYKMLSEIFETNFSEKCDWKENVGH